MHRIAAVSLGILSFAVCAVSLTYADESPKATVKSGGDFTIEMVKDIAYYDGSDADPIKHRLDLYLPKGAKDFPVLFFVHGGAWVHGDKKYLFDLYGKFARVFAKNGIGVVVTNYRLSPKIQHPEHIKDVAKAFAWTYRNIAKYGGRPDQLFVSGHSAGGHLVALLATDGSYLKAENLVVGNIKGAIPLSGVYTIPPGIIFKAAFGDDLTKRKEASPTSHVHGDHPPFLIVYAEADFPGCDKMSAKLCSDLKQCKCDACTLEVKERDHISIIVKVANEEDPAMQAMLEFIAKHSGLKLTAKEGKKAALR